MEPHRALLRITTQKISLPRLPFLRCSISSMKPCSKAARIRSRLIRTAARESAEPVHWSSMASPMGPAKEPPASFICGGLRTETPSGSNLFALPLFPRSRISWSTAALLTGSSKPAAISWLEPDPLLKRTHCPWRSMFADLAMEAAACIGCGACVAACPNSSAMLFVSAKVSHLGLLPQGQAERESRALHMVRQMDELGFGNCRNHYECEAICPAEVSATFIARLNRDYAIATAKEALAV